MALYAAPRFSLRLKQAVLGSVVIGWPTSRQLRQQTVKRKHSGRISLLFPTRQLLRHIRTCNPIRVDNTKQHRLTTLASEATKQTTRTNEMTSDCQRGRKKTSQTKRSEQVEALFFLDFQGAFLHVNLKFLERRPRLTLDIRHRNSI